VTVEVGGAVLRSTADDWDGRAEECGEVRRGLRAVSSAGFGQPSAALDAFVDTWQGRCDTLRTRAQAHADALRETAAGFEGSDRVSADAVRSLLPGGAG